MNEPIGLKDLPLGQSFLEQIKKNKAIAKVIGNIPKQYRAGAKALGEHFNLLHSATNDLARQIADPKCKPFICDPSFVQLVERTSKIPVEEMVGQIETVGVPFEKLWLEGIPLLEAYSGIKKIGAVVKRDESSKGFTFQVVTQSATDNTVGAYTVLPRVTARGIDLDEKRLLEHLERTTAAAAEMSSLLNAKAPDMSADIDLHYHVAEFLTRAFVVLVSQPKAHNLHTPPTSADLAAAKKLAAQNKIYAQMGRPPKLNFHRIIIDPTKVDSRLTGDAELKTLRALLGWTDVRQSRPIISKHGKVYTRQAHERRIPAPEDRRGMTVRKLTASDPSVALDISDQRPVLGPAPPPAP